MFRGQILIVGKTFLTSYMRPVAVNPLWGNYTVAMSIRNLLQHYWWWDYGGNIFNMATSEYLCEQVLHLEAVLSAGKQPSVHGRVTLC